MTLYPWSVLLTSNTDFATKVWGIATIVFCVLFVFWLYHHQKGINLIRAINEPTNIIVKITKCKKPSRGLADTDSALLNKADKISLVMYPENRNETTALSSQDTHIKESVPDTEIRSQSQVSITREHQSIEGRTKPDYLL